MPPINPPIKGASVAIQGELGSFHDVTAHNLTLLAQPKVVPCRTFKEAHDKMTKGEVDFALTALDNTIDGEVQTSVQELLRNDDAYIIEVVRTRIQQFLIGYGNVDLATLRGLGDSLCIISHPKALGQSRDRLKELLPDAIYQEHFDTAGAVRQVVELAGNPDKHGLTYLAVAGELALSRYADQGAQLVDSNPVSPPHNYTTFALISSKPMTSPLATDTALYVTQGEDRPGSLEGILRNMRLRHFSLLHPFRDRKLGLNLSRLNSISVATKKERYSFYMDVQSPLSNPNLQIAISQLRQAGNNVRVVGSYGISQVEKVEHSDRTK